jgi:hypothetical protein
MEEKKFIGKWIDDMNNYQKRKIKISKKREACDTFFAMFDSVKEAIDKNLLMFTISSLVAIPLLIVLLYMLNYVISNINDFKEIRAILALSGVMLVVPFISLYVYFIHILSAKKLPTLKVFLILILVALFMLNVIAGIESINLMEANKVIQGNLIFSAIFLDIFIVSFMITKLCFLLCTYISDIERGKRNVSIDNIEKIALLLEVQPYELLVKK